jgi:hypothetical protein
LIKKTRGRPPKSEGRRIKKIDARFTEEEYLLIGEMEKALGLKKTELLRLRLLDDSTRLVLNAKELIGELDKIGTELGRAGNNINQLARYANTLNKHGVLAFPVASRLNELLEDYQRQQRMLEASMRRIIRAMGH